MNSTPHHARHHSSLWPGAWSLWAVQSLILAALLVSTGALSAQAPTMKVGNLIFVDENGNGVADFGEGKGGVKVELWQTDVIEGYKLIDTTTSAADGFYVFNDLTSGTYKVVVPASEFAPATADTPAGPLVGMMSLPGAMLVGDDNLGEKGQDSFAPYLTSIWTLDFIVAPGFGPVGAEESGFRGNYDDADDTNGDMTVDFGFYRPLGIGNLIFADVNNNGHADLGEGVPGVSVQLYHDADIPGVDTPVQELVTDDTGHFLFGGLLPGYYKLFVPASQFQAGGILQGALSVPGVGNDNEDDDFGEDGIDNAHPEQNGIVSRTVTLAAGLAPTTSTGETGSNFDEDLDNDSDVDLTVDLGFVLPAGKVGVGNLVFIDTNNNGHYDDGEGAAGVTVQLFAAGADPLTDAPVAAVISAADGSYLVGNLSPGSYFLFIPPSQFGAGAPLFSALSVTGTQAGDDDAGEDGIDDAFPEMHGIRSAVFALTLGGAPDDANGETGYLASSDNYNDANVDLTHDFGFTLRAHNPVGVGNLVYIDANHNGKYDSGEGVSGVLMQLFHEGDDVSTATPVASQLTGADGGYLFGGLIPGRYVVHVAADSFGAGQPLSGMLSLPGNGVDNQADDDKDENGIDSPNPNVTGISSVVVTLAEGDEPVETGFHSTQDDELDTNIDLTIDFGFMGPCPTMTITTGTLPAGTTGVIYGPANLQVSGAPSAVAWTVSGGVLPPGLALSNAGSLIGTPTDVGTYLFTVKAALGDSCFVTTLCQVIINPPPGVLGVGNAIYFDANGNGVLDPGEGVANVDLQLFLEGDEPVTATPQAVTTSSPAGLYLFSGLAPGRYFVHVKASNFAPNKPLAGRVSATGVSADDGVDDNLPGNDNGIDSLTPASTGISSTVFELAAGTEPVSGALGSENGTNATSDDANDANVDLTIDFAFVNAPVPTGGIGNAIYIDFNHNGIFDAGEGAGGVKVQIFHAGDNPQAATPLNEVTTSNLGGYAFNGLVDGDYFVYVPASEFAIGKPLAGLISIPGVSNDDGVDDNVAGNDNGIDAANPAVSGVASVNVNLHVGSEPVDSGTETGFDAAADNAHDADFDSTIDLGFQLPCPTLVLSPSAPTIGVTGNAYSLSLSASGGSGPITYSVLSGSLPDGLSLSTAGVVSGTPTTVGSFQATIRGSTVDGCRQDWPVTFTIHGPLAVGNLVFFDRNGNGHADAGEGVDGVTVQIYTSTDTPGTTQPLASATTANGGFYLIDQLTPGQYQLYIPSAMFAQNGPLWKLASVAGVGTGDDDAGEAGQDAVDPTVTGVKTAIFSLNFGAAPTTATGETGLGSTTDDERDADVDLTKDFGFVDLNALPATFSSWATANGLVSGNGAPAANPDHDAYSNLIEYSLGMNPSAGGDDFAGAFSVTKNALTGKMEFHQRRRHGGQGDLTYTLQVLADLGSAQWTASSVIPVIVNNGDGTESVTYGNLDDDPALSGATSGFVRVLVALDADHNGVPEVTDTTPILGWQRRSFAVQTQTYAVSFVPVPVFTGTPDSVAGNTLNMTTSLGGGSFTAMLTAGREYYVEVMSGPDAGQRWEIDEASNTATSIALLPSHDRSTLTTVPATLASDLIAVRVHWRLVDLFPPTAYHATNSASTADQVLVWDQTTGGYVTLWLANYFGQSHWHNTAVASVTLNEDNRVISPCDGLFARPKFATVSAANIGQLRTWSFACPLKKGVNFIGNPFPVAQTPAVRGMYGTGGFTANAVSANADRINFWAGDTTGNATGYTTYQLYKVGAREIWKVVGSTDIVTDWGTHSLFTAGTAAFITSVNGRPGWIIPAPVVP